MNLIKTIKCLCCLVTCSKYVYYIKKAEKFTRLRSVQTLAGVLIAYVYFDEENPRMDSITRYGLNEKTFDKYYNIIFGDDSDEE